MGNVLKTRRPNTQMNKCDVTLSCIHAQVREMPILITYMGASQSLLFCKPPPLEQLTNSLLCSPVVHCIQTD